MCGATWRPLRLSCPCESRYWSDGSYSCSFSVESCLCTLPTLYGRPSLHSRFRAGPLVCVQPTVPDSLPNLFSDISTVRVSLIVPGTLGSPRTPTPGPCLDPHGPGRRVRSDKGSTSRPTSTWTQTLDFLHPSPTPRTSPSFTGDSLRPCVGGLSGSDRSRPTNHCVRGPRTLVGTGDDRVVSTSGLPTGHLSWSVCFTFGGRSSTRPVSGSVALRTSASSGPRVRSGVEGGGTSTNTGVPFRWLLVVGTTNILKPTEKFSSDTHSMFGPSGCFSPPLFVSGRRGPTRLWCLVGNREGGGRQGGCGMYNNSFVNVLRGVGSSVRLYSKSRHSPGPSPSGPQFRPSLYLEPRDSLDVRTEPRRTRP